MKLFLSSLLFISSCALPPAEPQYVPSEKCCLDFDGQGRCTQELVPGCASNASPLFKETYLIPDECCERWGKNGICYKEKILGCSRQK